MSAPMLDELKSGYLHRRLEDVRTLQRALDRTDFSTVQRLGHNLKGSGGSYGFPEITRLGAELEKAAADEDQVRISTHLANLSGFLTQMGVP